jgi:hypothetical protein
MQSRGVVRERVDGHSAEIDMIVSRVATERFMPGRQPFGPRSLEAVAEGIGGQKCGRSSLDSESNDDGFTGCGKRTDLLSGSYPVAFGAENGSVCLKER